jgi:putative membrane protein
MTHSFVIPLAAAIAVIASAAATSAQDASSQDKQFVAEATSGGMLEVRLGEYASFNAASDEVQKFGEQMVGDHSQANEKLKTIAHMNGIEMPRQLNTEDQKVLDMLEKLKGADFDKAYMAQMVEDHKKDVSAFEKEISAGSEIDVKGFAEKVLPTLKHHLQMAEGINAKR